jgi:hypothetical protein
MDGPLDRFRAFCFPGGEAAAALVQSVRIQQRGEIRSAPAARWMAFTADETIDATRSAFRWVARFGGGKRGWFSVTDAYEDGHGRLTIKVGGIVPVKSESGPDVDKGELQRYLADVMACPPMLLVNPSLLWTPASSRILRVEDRNGPAGASIDIEIADDGRPLGCRAMRPRLVGKRSILSPWFGTCSGFEEREGLRMASRLEVAWDLPEGPFTYYRSEATSFEVLRTR